MSEAHKHPCGSPSCPQFICQQSLRPTAYAASTPPASEEVAEAYAKVDAWAKEFDCAANGETVYMVLARHARSLEVKVRELEAGRPKDEYEARDWQRRYLAIQERVRHLEALVALPCPKDHEARESAALARAEKAEAFKAWVHAYLDKKGVPSVVKDEHLAAGCRIGGRMDWVFALLAEAEKALNEVFTADCVNECFCSTLVRAALSAIRSKGAKEPSGNCQGCGGPLSNVDGQLGCAPCCAKYKAATPEQRGKGTW